MKTNAAMGLLCKVASVCILLSFNSCKREDKGDAYEITGHVYHGCPKKGVANTAITLSWNKSGFLSQGSEGLIATAITDNNGYFKLTSDYYGEVISLYCKNEKIIENLKPKNLYDLEINQQATTVLKINLNVNNPYSVSDTLFVAASDSLGNQLIVAGSFTSGLLYTINNYHLSGNTIQNNNEYNSHPSISYHINRNTNNIAELINLQLCDTSTVTFTIK